MAEESALRVALDRIERQAARIKELEAELERKDKVIEVLKQRNEDLARRDY